MNIPLILAAEHEWRNLSSGGVIEWLEPFAAAWRAESSEIDFKYHKGQYATPFGDTLEWNINVHFQGLAHLTSEDIAGLVEE